ncbi:unnamed protein product [Brassica rapa]|uniref:Uncharacterized protein n=1 Tax=Brassica campestris TaxID=3711 RepID=A0A3P5Y3V3_BRACM|nr:unnamed protein product [Brassica rapa]VDC62029.1 unnamed protein product [Brassica rapa]
MANHGGIWLAVRYITQPGLVLRFCVYLKINVEKFRQVVKTIKVDLLMFVYTCNDLYEDETHLTCIANNELKQSVMTHFTTRRQQPRG